MTRPRLLVLASTYPATADDGTPAFIRDLALAEAEQFDTLVLVPRVPGSQPAEQQGPVRVVRFRHAPSKWEDLAHGAILENLRRSPARYLQVPLFLAAETVAVIRAVRRFRPDVIHVHWVVPQGLVASVVAPRVPTVVTTLGGDLYALRSAPMRALKRWVLRRADAVTVMNRQMRAVAIALGADPGSVQVMPMGADLGAVSGRLRERGPDGRIRLLFVGRLVEKKGLAVLLDALRDLPEGSVTLTVVGDGPLRSELETRAEGLPVRFLGQLGRAELVPEYLCHDVVVVPSVLASSGDQDGLPVALLEAMGAGCAVVAADLPGLNEAIVDGVSGILVPSGDAAALGAALRALSADPVRRESMGIAASARAEGYSVGATGEAYRQLLASVARIGAGEAGRR